MQARFPNSVVLNVSDGLHTRCLSVVVPNGVSNAPILFNFHGAGGSAANFGQEEDTLGVLWADLAEERGFGYVGGEAVQWSTPPWVGGQWLIPEVQTDETGLKCDETNDRDLVYLKNAIKALGAMGPFDTSRVFLTGCSMGSAVTIWLAQCLHQQQPGTITAFGTQSTGLKEKGDGLSLPTDNYNPTTTWDECDTCQYFPAPVVKTEGLKACITDQTEDDDFYQSSLALNASWLAAGMRADIRITAGQHCQTQNFTWIANCLDDGTGRLLA